MAMNRLPARSGPSACFTRSKKYALKMLGSSVEPDLLETMNSVFFRSTCSSRAFTCAGSVESRTRSSGEPGTWPKVSRQTSGHRLEPPMPSSSAWVKPSCRASSRIWPSGARSSSCASTMPSHPSQLASSLFVHRDASPAHSRCVPPCASHSSSFRATSAARAGGRQWFCPLIRALLASRHRRWTALSSRANGSANFFRPSASRSSVTLPSETPLFSSSPSVCCAPAMSVSSPGRARP